MSTSEKPPPKIDLLNDSDRVKLEIESKLREHRFLWANVSQRNRNSWSMGAFFVPISFLIFAYAATAKYLQRSDILPLYLASILGYSSWLILYWRNNRANKTYIDRAKKTERTLRESYGIDYQPLTETDDQRKGWRKFWLSYCFPDFAWGTMLLVLIILWNILIIQK